MARSLRAYRDRCPERVSMVVVDYLQLLKAPGAEEYERVTTISRGLKAMAMDLEVPVLALCQFNRQGANRGEMPHISDLKGSSSLEQDADNVLVIHRPGLYSDEKPADLVECRLAKARNGEPGTFSLRANMPVFEFYEPGPRRAERFL